MQSAESPQLDYGILHKMTAPELEQKLQEIIQQFHTARKEWTATLLSKRDHQLAQRVLEASESENWLLLYRILQSAAGCTNSKRKLTEMFSIAQYLLTASKELDWKNSLRQPPDPPAWCESTPKIDIKPTRFETLFQ